MDLFHPEDAGAVRAMLQGALANPRHPQRWQGRVLRRDQRWCWAEGTTNNLSDDPDVRAIVWNFRDITDRKAAEQEKAQRTAELARSNAELQAFAYAAAHDLTEPLRTVCSYAQLLQRSGSETERQEYAGVIVDSVTRMGALLDGLLVFARMDLDGLPCPVELRHSVEKAIKNLDQAVKESGARILFDPLPVVQGSESHLIELFQNLISNAIKYRSEAPVEVRISSEPFEQEWLISMQERLETVEPDPGLRTKFSTVLKRAWTSEFTGSPGAKYQEVVNTVLGRPVRMYVVDAACSSSLYSIHLGMRALQNHSADAVLAAGVFAPGPANSTLFAQFRGLTPEASRPLDAAADGVVFGQGAGVLVLKRLTDAVSDGDRIVSVVRAVGVSSDGKSPAINVPQSKGQSLAVRRAYERSGIEADTIQYVEAHATGTPVGDAVEFQALRESLPRTAGLPPIELGSIKSLIGHTGWAAGAASVIKLCKAFENRTVPGQYNFTRTGPDIPLEGSQFTISKTSHEWPENVAGAPRRAAINGFGFGGTNAHLVLEEYSESYHKKLCGRAPVTPPAKLAVIHWAALFPARQQLAAEAPNGERRFERKLLRLPKGKMLLPDVCEHMDPGQYLESLSQETCSK